MTTELAPAPVHKGRRLDWFPRFDPASLNYPMAAGPATPEPTSGRLWTPGKVLDQGAEGACVGFGCAMEAASEPVPVPRVSGRYARGWYHNAQRRDEWPGEAYDGTSVLAGMLEGRARGVYGGFTWATAPEQLAAGIVADGPAVIGVEWRDGSYSTDHQGVLRPSGRVVGGHCLCLLGYVPALQSGSELHAQLDDLGLLPGVLTVLESTQGAFVGMNSWGPSFGRGGLFAVGMDTVREWFAAGGEFAQPVGRQLPTRKGEDAVADEEGQERPGDVTLHITAAEVREGDRLLDPPDDLRQESVTVLGSPQQVTNFGGRRVVVRSTAGTFQLGAADAVTVRRST